MEEAIMGLREEIAGLSKEIAEQGKQIEELRTVIIANKALMAKLAAEVREQKVANERFTTALEEQTEAFRQLLEMLPTVSAERTSKGEVVH